MRWFDKFFQSQWMQALVTYPTGMYSYYMGMTIMKGAGVAAFSWSLIGGFALIIFGFIVVQTPMYYYRMRHTTLNVHIRTDTGQPVIVDGDDIDGDGRGGDTLRRMGIID